MRIYKNFIEATDEMYRELFEKGLRIHPGSMQDKVTRDDKNYETIELSPYVYSVVDTSDYLDIMKKYKKNVQWLEADFKERMTPGINPGEAYKLRDEWAEFVHDGKFQYTYSERLHFGLEQAIETLKKFPNSRQAVVGIYDQCKDEGKSCGKTRIPCSICYQFIIRQGKLNMIYVMRSCDIMAHFIYDISLATMTQRYIAKELGIEPGTFTHFITSFHAYKKDFPEGVF